MKTGIFNYIKDTINEKTFNEIQELDGVQYNHMNYEDFLEHNKNCINNLDDSDVKFTFMLCQKLINKEIICIIDEHGYGYQAYTIYFDVLEHNLTIKNYNR